MGLNGMVACSQPLAAEAGHSILKDGGNAVDAAIAIAAALNVTEPCSTGLGGDCFLLYYDAATKKTTAMNGSGRAPAALDIDRVRADCPDCGAETPLLHPHTVTVPGTAAGWADAMDKWGSKTLAEVLAPAISLAENGYPVHPVCAHHWGKGEPQLRGGPHFAELMVSDPACPDGVRPPRAGEVFRNPTLASVMRELAEGGKEAFYSGRAGQSIVALLGAMGGAMTAEDLAGHTTTFDEPIGVSYGGVTLLEQPPSGQGITALIALQVQYTTATP